MYVCRSYSKSSRYFGFSLVDCGTHGGSNDYLQSMFWSKKKIGIPQGPANPSFPIQKVGFWGIHYTDMFLCPQLRKKLRGHIGLGLSVHWCAVSL